MKADQLAKILERVEHWPAHARDELAIIALEIEAELKGEVYQLSPEELEAIDLGRKSPLATDAEVEALFAKYRDK